MPTSDEPPELLVDTSVAVALLVLDHHDHETTFNRIGHKRLGLAGHAAFETFSVLTRLPPPARRSPAAAGRLLAANFGRSHFLGPAAAAELLGSLAGLRLAGGSVYDALVGAAAKEAGITLVTRDRRAVDTYRALDVDFELIT
jgi:predicted nucleic acid-binding protein